MPALVFPSGWSGQTYLHFQVTTNPLLGPPDPPGPSGLSTEDGLWEPGGQSHTSARTSVTTLTTLQSTCLFLSESCRSAVSW